MPPNLGFCSTHLAFNISFCTFRMLSFCCLNLDPKNRPPKKIIPLHPGPTMDAKCQIGWIHLFFGKKGKMERIIQKVTIWVFPKIGIPQHGWFMMENPIKMDDLGYHYFWKHPSLQHVRLFVRFVISPYLRCNLRKRSTDVLMAMKTSIGLPNKPP